MFVDVLPPPADVVMPLAVAVALPINDPLSNNVHVNDSPFVKAGDPLRTLPPTVKSVSSLCAERTIGVSVRTNCVEKMGCPDTGNDPLVGAPKKYVLDSVGVLPVAFELSIVSESS